MQPNGIHSRVSIKYFLFLDRDFQPPHKTSDVSGKVVYDNSPDPEVKYVSNCLFLIPIDKYLDM